MRLSSRSRFLKVYYAFVTFYDSIFVMFTCIPAKLSICLMLYVGRSWEWDQQYVRTTDHRRLTVLRFY